jgi:hypothetical protein
MRRTVVGCVSLAAMVVVALLVAPAPVGARPAATQSSSTQTLAPGLTLTRIADPAGPYRVYVLTVDPSKPVTIDVATAAGAMGNYARPSSIGSTHQALAAINGDFTIDPGRPLHPFAEDGTLRQLGLQNGASFAISHDETAKYVGEQSVRVAGRNLDTKAKFAVAEFNTGDPARSSIVGYTPYGGSAEHPPRNACSVRMKAYGKLRWSSNDRGVSRDYVVDRIRCSAKVLRVQPSTVVLSARLKGLGSRVLQRTRKGEMIRLTWSFGWTGVMDSVGGMPMLVDNGKVVAPAKCNSYFCSRNPRTGIAVTADGKVLLAVVDGRRNKAVGMTLSGFGHYLIDLGATYAINLDGGGGSSMWVQGQGVISQPSDRSGERPVTNAVLVLPGADPGEADPAPFTSRSPLGAGPHVTGAPTGLGGIVSVLQARRAMGASLADPGSTGGLMAALVSDGFGDAGPVPPSYLAMARSFHARLR